MGGVYRVQRKSALTPLGFPKIEGDGRLLSSSGAGSNLNFIFALSFSLFRQERGSGPEYLLNTRSVIS